MKIGTLRRGPLKNEKDFQVAIEEIIDKLNQVIKRQQSGLVLIDGAWGTVTLEHGMATVTTKAADATHEVVLIRKSLGTHAGELAVVSVAEGESFQILSNNLDDDGEVLWLVAVPE